MNTCNLFISKLILAACFSVFSLTGVANAADNFTVNVSFGEVSINAHNADLKELLLEFERQAGIPIKFVSDINEKISLEINNTSVENAIAKLTPDHMVIYETNGSTNIKELVVISKELGTSNENAGQSAFLPTGNITAESTDAGPMSAPVENNEEPPPAVFVDGEVNAPGEFLYQPGMTVGQAISLAGGFTNRASKQKVFVSGEADEEPPSRPSTLQAPIKPGDMVFVEEGFF